MFEAKSQYEGGGLGREVGVSTGMRLGRGKEEADLLARQGSSAVVRGGVGLARLTCSRLRANTRVEAEAEKSESVGRV